MVTMLRRQQQLTATEWRDDLAVAESLQLSCTITAVRVPPVFNSASCCSLAHILARELRQKCAKGGHFLVMFEVQSKRERERLVWGFQERFHCLMCCYGCYR
mmetsp:Transcript_117752/g.228943  ORF Transcript_117752/g.228943 Transcript_117752/m.228943 type:complete len:102 (-) Transcript_117752:250-555(-)